MDVAITGSSGLIGSRLVATLSDAGHRPIRIVRREPAPGADEIRWQPATGDIDADSLEGIDAVIHLAGAGIGDKRWNDSYRELLLTSRTEPTALLASTLAKLTTAPKVFLSGSAIGFYGDRGEEVLTESSPAGDGFLAELVKGWEAAAQPAIEAGIRTALLRTGLVQTPEGGALAKLLPLFRLGLGGRFGSGAQYQSWITIDDEVGAIVHLLDADVSGPVNLTAPNPVTNAEFTKALAKVLGRPTLLPIPAFGPRLLLGSQMANALLFESQKILPAVLEDSGYDFSHKTVDVGLRAVLGR